MSVNVETVGRSGDCEAFPHDGDAWLIKLVPTTPCGVALCGDCNLDGQVSILDALAASSHTVHIITLSPRGFSQCNVFGVLEPDPAAAVNVLDSFTIAMFVVSLPVTLVCC